MLLLLLNASSLRITPAASRMLEAYSGIAINQNQPPADPRDLLPAFPPETTPIMEVEPSPALDPSPLLFPAGISAPATTTYYTQTFSLPSDYGRGSPLAPVYPALSGFQLRVQIAPGHASTAAVQWVLEAFDGIAWHPRTTGFGRGAPSDGQTWMSVYFADQVTISDPTEPLRIRLLGLDGIQGFVFSTPSPLTSGQLFLDDGITPVLNGGQSVCLMFRLLAMSADSGIDFLGDIYRSAAIKASGHDMLASSDAFWLSQPNPSQFGVESVYLDVRDGSEPVVIDRFTLDPLTPGINFHIYYSSDPAPGVDDASWENLLWTPVYKTFQAVRRETYALPSPVGAKYLKFEFSRLQARSYTPGAAQTPSTFKRHPKWVLDFFISLFDAASYDVLSPGVDVIYDALDLAFSYYSDDIIQIPDRAALSSSLAIPLLQFGQSANVAGSATLIQLALDFQPFTSPPATQGDFNSILGSVARSLRSTNYSTEQIVTAVANTSLVSNQQREALLVEKGLGAMFFFVPSRHAYRVSQASFDADHAYFAGVQELVLHREAYTTGSDQTIYNEPLGDAFNLDHNDFDYPLPRFR